MSGGTWTERSISDWFGMGRPNVRLKPSAGACRLGFCGKQSAPAA